MVLSKNVEAIELCHLRYFLAAAEQGSFRKAGIGLGLSQSAVSRCIADLEDQIGASLFHRHSWGVSQTYAGRRFLRRAREAMRSIAEGAYDVALAGRSEQGRNPYWRLFLNCFRLSRGTVGHLRPTPRAGHNRVGRRKPRRPRCSNPKSQPRCSVCRRYTRLAGERANPSVGGARICSSARPPSIGQSERT